MAKSIDTMPLMIGDIVRLLPAIISDLMIKPNQRPAEVEQALKQIGGRCSNERKDHERPLAIDSIRRRTNADGSLIR